MEREESYAQQNIFVQTYLLPCTKPTATCSMQSLFTEFICILQKKGISDATQERCEEWCIEENGRLAGWDMCTLCVRAGSHAMPGTIACNGASHPNNCAPIQIHMLDIQPSDSRHYCRSIRIVLLRLAAPQAPVCWNPDLAAVLTWPSGRQSGAQRSKQCSSSTSHQQR